MESKRVKPQLKKNLWKPEEDLILKNYVETHGEGNWATVSERSGLMRGGKSCRLRWKNYLRPNIKRGEMSKEEEDLIIRMHKLLGNRWSLIAGRLPGRTDNEVKNYWNTHLNKKCLLGKRKEANSNHHEEEDNDDSMNKKNKLGPPFHSEPHGSSLIGLTSTAKLGLEEGSRKEESTVTEGNWIDYDTSCFNRDIMDYPIMPEAAGGGGAGNSASFVFDDEPLVAFMDSFVLFEAFGFGGGEEL